MASGAPDNLVSGLIDMEVSVKITSEKQAKHRQQEALEMLAEVRDWVWERGTELLPDGVAQVNQHNAFWHAAFRVWWYSLNDGMRIMDAGWDDKGKPARVVFESENSSIVRLDSDTERPCRHCQGHRFSGEQIDKAVDHYVDVHQYRLIHLGQETHNDQDGKAWHTTVAFLKP